MRTLAILLTLIAAVAIANQAGIIRLPGMGADSGTQKSFDIGAPSKK